MWIVLDEFSRTLIDAAVANAILLSLIVAVVVFTRQPARRVVLARSGVYAALLMFPLAAFHVAPTVYPVDWLLSTGLVPPPLVPEQDPLDIAAPPALVPPGGAHASRRSGGAPAEWPAGERLVRVGALLYLAGAAVGLAWMGLGLWGFRRLVDRSREPCPTLRAAFDELVDDLGRSPPHPTLRVSSRLRRPVLGGVIRPVILVPAEIDREDFDRDALRLILLHELAHADRGDAWFHALAGLTQVLWFFLPHLWWLRGQMRIDQEFLADRKAAAPLGESTRYARWLVGLSSGRLPRVAPSAAPEAPPAAAPTFWGAGGFNTQLLQRVAMLLYCPFAVEGRPPRWFLIAAPGSVALVAVALSSCRFLAPVDSAALHQRARAIDPLMRNFPVPEFVVVPLSPSPTGPASYVLPMALPQVFRLESEVVASRRALGRLRIVNCPLTPDHATLAESPPDGPVETHRFTLRRNYAALRASLDGEEFDLDPRLLHGVNWLSITPADEVATLRRMVVTW
ncbi:M56 family metallopeptidase [Paludisphaera sp.]|uniref:M56 family metallopeptidase n=1 Tax=Paludisphaera sp. TaxID=2017432 RepID=UPI00301BC32B